ncbi:MAG: ATP-binding cassette domain-containing protein [Actinobacteria bacterium]|nr:MAG: ATP-binding cassette domain-containing protein [Actinomycetota bacterium]
MTAAALARTGTELRRAFAEARSGWSTGAWIAVAVVALAALVPFLSLPGVRTDALANTLYLAVAATGLGLTVGAAGLPSLGQGAFLAVGAFTSALLMAREGWPLEPAALAGGAAAIVAALLSGGVVRLRPAFVAVSTWLLAWLVWLFLLAFPSVSGGSQGLIVPEKNLLGLSATPTVHFEVALGLLVLSAVGIAAVRRGAPGLELSALRQAPPLATSLGVRLGRRRLGAFAASAFLAGLAGGLSVQLSAVADPSAYDPFFSFKLLVAVLLGGAAATLGPAVGIAALGLIGLVADPLARLLQLPLERFDTAVAAILLLFVLALGGAGIVPWLEPWIARLRRPEARARRARAGGLAVGPMGNDAALRAEGLRKAFGGVVALDGLSLELTRGETAALVGPNGSGKTTALRLLSGTERPDAGRVLLGERDLADEPTHERVRLGLARTLQTTVAFPELTALESVLVGRTVRRRHGGAIKAALATPQAREEQRTAEAAGVEALALVGLDGQAETPVPELTSSQRRLVALAGALASEPQVLLVDELAAGAGADELDRLAEIVERIRGSGVAILLVEHNLRLIRLVAGRVIVLDAGRAVAEGSLTEVAESDVVRSSYLGARRL